MRRPSPPPSQTMMSALCGLSAAFTKNPKAASSNKTATLVVKSAVRSFLNRFKLKDSKKTDRGKYACE